MYTDSQDRPAQTPSDPKGPGETVVTDEMIEAGVEAFGLSGYSLDDVTLHEALRLVFVAMAGAAFLPPSREKS